MLFDRTLQKMVLLVRMDLQMSPGKIAAQCAHAALECYLKQNKGFKGRYNAQFWLMLGQPKIVLKVKDQEELISLGEEAMKAGLNVVAVRDAGKTELKPGTITVVGIGPNSEVSVDSVTQHLKLL